MCGELACACVARRDASRDCGRTPKRQAKGTRARAPRTRNAGANSGERTVSVRGPSVTAVCPRYRRVCGAAEPANPVTGTQLRTEDSGNSEKYNRVAAHIVHCCVRVPRAPPLMPLIHRHPTASTTRSSSVSSSSAGRTPSRAVSPSREVTRAGPCCQVGKALLTMA